MIDAHDTDRSTQTPQAGRWPWFLLVMVTALTILVDQASKAYVVKHLDLYESWMPFSFLSSFFRITHVRNTGAAFGIFPDGGNIFLLIAVAVSAIIIYYYRQLPSGAHLIRLALGLQMGGALGNVIDRIRLGYVVDFLNVEFWPVFNVADSCIVIGVALLILEIAREDRRVARRKRAEGEQPKTDSSPSQKMTSG